MPKQNIALALLTIAAISRALSADDFQPNQKELPVPPPEGAIVLLSSDTNEFLSKNGGEINWPLEDGVLTSTRGEGRSNHIVSKPHFRDADIHVEFKLPKKGSGNSGIYIHGNYELQIINSVEKEKLDQGDIGAVYGFAPALVNAGKGPDEWQVYDIRYTAPRRDESGKIVEEGTITAWLNGQKVQEGTKLGEPRSNYHPYRYNTTDYLKTIWEKQKQTGIGPVFLQDHDNAVQFRNVWVKPLDDKALEYQADK
ncbi:hypothetical protein C5Y96_24170 [Blastopirellula marina]|uniref:3-keto-alpha-glucoside-1,2-lyase/3-keto-2-hydroxy-glucal hydratase domain-containing protein n=1 Tax=Blastopirellula marina TaxID=124 RepID=A0A2S8EZY4_9BACT|nr:MULTISPECIES: DUF1080 domain-containing protein [Pirellulaceae]PQO25441.1 hypothetical protein C5Y96_24170 [Blastopirellula marina]RCS42405.1 DUF1080 domain-containing protein [Bremerella cremea]